MFKQIPLTKIIAVVFAFLVVGCAILGGYILGVQADPLQTVEVQNIFADLDGDGRTDLIIDATVIFNRPFQPPAPAK